ncbi:MAG: OmcA/MtrC family decaheme c-type cytochrome [Thermoanaerobaculia bacterium]
MSLVSRTAFTLLAGLVAVPFTPVTRPGSTGSPERQASPAAYAVTAKEAYLAPEALTYIRPGFNIKIASVTNFAPGQKPVVEMFLTDDLKGPLDRNGLVTPGVISMRFIPALWNPATERYLNYLGYNSNPALNANPTRDNTGTWTDLEVGHYKYTFAAAMPSTMDDSKPHTLAAMGVRNTTDIVGKNYYAVPQYYDAVPKTNAAATTWNLSTVAKCNACHDPIAPHGGNYRDLKTCALCHNPNNMRDTIPATGGEPAEDRGRYNGELFWHRIHAGLEEEVVPGMTYPQDIRNCDSCHDKTAAGGDSWYTQPSIAACGSCHSDLNFVTGANHVAGPAADGSCATCHPPQGNAEWDAGIKNAHVVPLHSAQLKGYTAKILSVTNAGPGKKITVTFQLKNGDGSFVDPGVYKVAANGSISIKLGGPTSDYTNVGMAANGQPFSENLATATYNATTGIATYTFTNAIPATAKGTYTVSIDTRRTVTLNPAPRVFANPPTISEGAPNVPFYFAVTGTTVTPRRTSVSLTKCNACHQDLKVLFSHGNQRITLEHCVICHNPNGSDAGRRTADTLPGESIELARMIHRIHTGENLNQDFTVYGFSGPSNFNDVLYPGDRRNCLACHVNAAAYSLPLPITNQPVVTDRDFFSPRGSATAACTGCHDSRDVAAHAYINTAYFPNSPAIPAEACGTCHATGADYDVAKVHAR